MRAPAAAHPPDETGRGWTVAVFAAAVLVRALAAWPTGKFPADPDALLPGMRTLDILQGRFHVFHTYVRFGCVESYLHAPFVALLGPTRVAVTFAPVIEGLLAVACLWAIARRVLPHPAALLATLFFAVPAARFFGATRLPTGYATVLACGVAILALAAVWAERPRAVTAAALGLAAGLGLWCSILTLSCTAAAALWLALAARRLPLRRLLLPAGSGFVLGALPWLAFNATHAFASLRDNYGTTPTRSIAAAFANFFYGLTGGFVELVGGPASGGAIPPLAALAVAFHAGAVVWFVANGLRGKYGSAWALPALAAFLSLVFFSVSSAGEYHLESIRFFVLCGPLVAISAGTLAWAVWRRARPAGVLVASGLVVWHLAGYEMPWSQARAARLEAAAEDARLLAFLDAERIDAIVGEYWSVYSFNYLSGGRVRAVSADPLVDYHGYGSRLPDRGVRWALVSELPGVVERWSARRGPAGTLVQVGRYTVLLPDPNPPGETSAEFQRRVQLAFLLPERIVTADTNEFPLALWR
ncbi:MAG: glycosyltransferase family 39 protein [Acidobacteria bacterium]|nr:glycosyltransferase family 39 protein [Acidobacteriota bacterium]